MPVRSLGERGLPLAFVRLAQLLHRERYDVVNAYGFKSTAVARVLARLLQPRAVFVSGVRGLHVAELERLDGLKSRLVLRAERALSGLVDAYDANSAGAVELLARKGVARERLRYIPNGIDAERWPTASPNGTAPPAVLCVARFVPRKRHQDLLRAAAMLAERGVEARFVLVGDGPTLPDMRRLAAELGIERNVEFPGARSHEEIRQLARSATAFCLGSVWEGMAGGVMEAMASALPVVGTEVNGIAELVEHGETGLLVPPERPDLLADALERLLRDPGRAAEMGRAGRRRIAERFSVERMVADKQRLFLELAGTR